MNKIISLLFFSTLAIGQEEYNIKHIVGQNSIYKKKFTNEIVDGKVFKMYDDIKVPLGNIINGKKEGNWKFWNPNGTLYKEVNYFKGKRYGITKLYYKNGNLKEENNYVGDYLNGITISWDNKGVKLRETNYENNHKIGVEIYYRPNGEKRREVDYIDSLNYSVINFNDDGSLMCDGIVVNGNPFDGTFFDYGVLEDGILAHRRKMIKSIENGKLVKIEWFDKLDFDSKDVIKIVDCINTDDCLSKKEKEEKHLRENPPPQKIKIYEKSPFRLYYTVHKYIDGNEIEFIINNMTNNLFKSVWFNISFYNKDKIVNVERVSFISLRNFGDKTKIIHLDDEFDKIIVEYLKSKKK
ncbi:MAG: hypothetical protein ISR83_07820 [Candidatus Marinimicrobia bacterium]|nr:hypothetical protein [Candidatus Neomarinimicrobiota bacterium]